MSCGEDRNPDRDLNRMSTDLEEDREEPFAWICYHPGTKHHDAECVENFFPDGCYVKGDTSKFCWFLDRDECDENSNRMPACKIFD